MYILSAQYVETLISGTHSGKTVVSLFALIWSPIKGGVNRKVIGRTRSWAFILIHCALLTPPPPAIYTESRHCSSYQEQAGLSIIGFPLIWCQEETVLKIAFAISCLPNGSLQ